MNKWHEAEQYLRGADSRIAGIMERAGPCELMPNEDGFSSLSNSIIGQQLSNHVANIIRNRFRKLFENDKPVPELLLNLDDSVLRKVGLSFQKIKYLRGLAQWVKSGELDFSALLKMDDEIAIQQLVQVKGIGRWTAEMYLMFSLNRQDLLPLGDAALEAALKRLYELPEEGWEKPAISIAEKWRPWRTVACWYLYRYHKMLKDGVAPF
ncbi:MAG TPA: DNA-3-methyladenine glycosylase 2 family protein [Deltaproteobacteria bacterium]|nr:DNA-3-methyladenine glycosylase 2 family protein [SAR324 cluster bacterium]HBL55086.1 DNA-3-methyladenine glycosylase 2 family protein [Deltaproteobacteria bacterium]HIB93073.1 DNA-3-methyladenine glycosylase 2 family protein [Candidatus Lambdaproteobacteria bacterium]HIN48884.1 DNA-3-methyladenine glycosylase 2 family protein [Deltaproteobacteria bacterium]